MSDGADRPEASDAVVASAALLPLIDLVAPWAVRVAATLRLADSIENGVTRLEELASEVRVNSGALGRLLRYLCSIGVFQEPVPGTFGLAPAGRLLVDGHPSRLRAWLDLNGIEGRMARAWPGLLDAIRTGEPSYFDIFGSPFWDDLDANPELGASFDALMATNMSEVAADLVAGFDWSAVSHVVDVGGGTGTLLTEILRSHSSARGTLVELPARASAARKAFARAGLAERCEVVEGSFFDPLLDGGDAYVLSGILHDWDDRHAAMILSRCAEAAGPDGVVVVVERFAGAGGEHRTVAGMDLLMLVLLGGRERTVAELGELAASAGLRVQAVHRRESGRSFVELRLS